MANQQRAEENKWSTTGEKTSLRKVLLFAVVWIAFNLILALLNKWLFQFEKFTFPIFIILTGVYTTFLLSSVCVFWFKFEEFPKTQLIRENIYFLTFLALSHGMSLALENISIERTSISFNQIIKATTPLLTLAFGYFVEKKRYYPAAIFSTFLIAFGAVLATYKVPSFDTIGLFTSLASEFFGVAKAIASAILLRRGIKPMSMIVLISLPATLSILPMYLQYEHTLLVEFMSMNHHASFDLSIVVAINWFAVFYNLVTLYLLAFTSAHYFNVVANIKVVVLIVVSMYVFHVRVTPMNAFGMLVSTIGFCTYTYLRFSQREEISPPSTVQRSPSIQDERNINTDETP